MKCLYPDCEDPEVSRGLCAKHYAAVRRLVKAGTTTWDELVAQHKALPLKVGERTQEILEWVRGS